jgi:hypothetical protein
MTEEQAGEVELLGPSKPLEANKGSVRPRKCLKCGRYFMSTHSLHRFCPSCSALNRLDRSLPEYHLHPIRSGRRSD